MVSNWYNWTQYTLDDVNKMLKKDQNNNETNNDLVAKSEYCELWQLASIYDVGNVWNFAFWKHFCLDDLRTQLIPLQNRVNETILEECIQKMNHRYKYNYLLTWGPLIYFIHLFWITHPTNYYSWVRYPKENMSYVFFLVKWFMACLIPIVTSSMVYMRRKHGKILISAGKMQRSKRLNATMNVSMNSTTL